MVLEGGAAVGRQQAVSAVQVAAETALIVAGNAVAENQIMHAAADIDGIHLHVAEVGEGFSDRGNGPVKQERPPVKTTSERRTDAQ